MTPNQFNRELDNWGQGAFPNNQDPPIPVFQGDDLTVSAVTPSTEVSRLLSEAGIPNWVQAIGGELTTFVFDSDVDRAHQIIAEEMEREEIGVATDELNAEAEPAIDLDPEQFRSAVGNVLEGIAAAQIGPVAGVVVGLQENRTEVDSEADEQSEGVETRYGMEFSV
jgi:hypothetical protein